jgi:preprotein translocase subunit SecA
LPVNKQPQAKKAPSIGAFSFATPNQNDTVRWAAVRHFLQSLLGASGPTQSNIRRINQLRPELSSLSNDDLRFFARQNPGRLETMAAAAAVASRILGLEMFDVQLHGALAMTDGCIAEMQTGEGKTLAAVPAVICYARGGNGIHVMTVNDYLARRDALWMEPVYEFFGLSVGYVQRNMVAEERKRAYSCDITYVTANEVGFDYLRDELALYPSEQVHRSFMPPWLTKPIPS